MFRWRQQQAITQQDLDNAKQTNQSQKAQVAAAQAQVETAKAQIEAAKAGVAAAAAAVETAKVNLGFTKLTSPIDGIAGVATMQVGNLVGPSSNAITTVSTLDPIKANFTVSEQEYLSLTRSDAALRRTDARTRARRWHGVSAKRSLLLCRPPGERQHRLHSIDRSCFRIPATGCVPDSTPRCAPRSACERERCWFRSGRSPITQGNYLVAVVDPNNTIRFAPVKVGDRIGSKWVVEEGLKPGERVVTDGLFKIAPGARVNPKEAK